MMRGVAGKICRKVNEVVRTKRSAGFETQGVFCAD